MKIIVTILTLLVVIVASCDSKKTTETANIQETKKDTVKVFLLDTASAQKTISLPGNLLPFEKVHIRAKIAGYISKIKVDIGSRVSKGQILALIDAPEINTRLQELSAKEKVAFAHYQSSKDYYDRIYASSKSDGVISASELEKAKTQMLADEADYNATKFASTSYKQTENYLAIVAPYSGIITKRNINVGSFVGNSNELPLFEIEDNKVLRLQVAVPEIYTNAILANNKGELTTSALPEKKFKANLVRKSGNIDISTRSEIWEFEIPNLDLELKSGSYADVKLHFLRTKPSLVIPVSAVMTTLEKRFVIKVMNDTTEWVDVRNGLTIGDKQEIFGDLKIGDTIVLKPNEELKPGKKIIIKKI